MYRSFFKGLLDFSVAFVTFVILSPLFIAITACLLIVNQGKPFFFQTRAGLNDKLFRIIKFKTMSEKRDAQGNLLPVVSRITPIGKFLRKTSLDELPQLINVLKGDMSLIGPRPLLVDYLTIYSTEQARRHEVKPGITGWAQVNGRNAISWKQKFEYDVWYVDHRSFLLDIKIIFLTLKKVFTLDGINSRVDLSMERFTGQ